MIPEENVDKIYNQLPKSVSYFNIDVKKVLTPVEETLKLKTTEPVHYERGDVIMFNGDENE